MRKTVVLHKNTMDYVYVKARNKLILRLETAKNDFKHCRLIYWARTEIEIGKRKSKEMELRYRDNMLDYYYVEIEFSKIARYTKYFFELTDEEGEYYYYTDHELTKEYPTGGYFEFLYANPGDVIQIPEWSKGQIYYQIFPDRFRNGDSTNDPKNCAEWGEAPTRENYMGGDLRGIIEKLDYIKSLGTDCIYLNPIFKGDFNHKYATTDYYQVDEGFGTNEELKELADECHNRGMRLILDGVFNHCGTSFQPFRDALENQESSVYKDWFHFHQFPAKVTHKDYECVGAYKWMPKLCTSNPSVCSFILEVMEFWIEYAGIDGWRLDVADEVDPNVWRSARVHLKAKYPDILLLGETWGFGRKMLSGDQLDSVMNYVFRDTMLDYIAYGKIDAVQLDERLQHMLAEYYEEYNHAMYNLLDTHDTPRFLHCCGENKNKFKLAVAFQFLMPGAPAIYYGDEVGLTGDNDPDCRRAMQWDEELQDQDLLSWYRRLSEIRHQEEAIRYGDFKTITADKDYNIYSFERSYENIHIKVIVNNSKEAAQVSLFTVKEENMEEILLPGEQCNKNFSEDGDRLCFQLEPYSVKIIKSEEVKNYEQNKKNTGNLSISRSVPGSSHSL